MKGLFYLAWRYVCFHRWRSAILVVCLTLTFFLPASIHFLVGNFEASLWKRSEETPLVVGAKGSRFDLVLNALYFRARTPDSISLAEMNEVSKTGLGLVVPIHSEFRARKHPIVGTTMEYFERRGLRVAEGRSLIHLGECVVGARMAAKLGLKVGDALMSDPENVFNLAGEYPLKMSLVGILGPSDSADDDAVFVDLKTAWIVAGIGHGHTDLQAPENEEAILRREENNIVANAALIPYLEVTPENRDSFHFHAKPEERPLTALLVFPRDTKSGTILRGRYQGAESSLQVLRPNEVVREMMSTVSQVKQFLNLNFVVVAVIAGLFLVLVVLLSLRLREKEMETLFLLGCRRGTVFSLIAMELGLVLVGSLLTAVCLCWMTYSAFELWLARILV